MLIEFEDIPKDWKVIKLEEICEKIKAGGTPLTTIKEYWNGDIPFVKIEDITNSNKYLFKTSSYISTKGLENSNSWIIPENSLLLTMYGSLGEVAINKIPVASNQAILGIIPKNKEDVEFLYYWFLYFKPRWRKFAKPTTQANLTAEIVKNVKLLYPPLEERKKIVDVLSSVDAYIQKTDEIIAKSERLKKGLMEELLTGRIRVEEKDGKIVFRKETEFKEDAKIGKIPKDWEVVKLETIFNFKNGRRPEFKEIGKIPVYGANGIMGYSDKFIVDNDFTLVIGRVGAPGEVHLGQGRIWISDNAIYSENYKNSIIYPPFAYYMLKFKELNTFASKTTHPLITQTLLNNFQIPLPSINEQQKIAEILLTIDKKLELERKRKEKIERIKKGLMDLLLTGKVRVKV